MTALPVPGIVKLVPFPYLEGAGIRRTKDVARRIARVLIPVDIAFCERAATF